MKQISSFFGQLLRVVLIRTLRGSFLISGGIMLLAATGPWQYMASSFNAFDLRRAAGWSDVSRGSPQVVVAAIDDAGYEGFFSGRSPLDQARLLELLRNIDQAVPQARGILVDLDLAPAPGVDPAPLLQFFSMNPGRWILADPVVRAADDTPTRRQWRDALCRLGVRIGVPYLPTEFGYVVAQQQYADSLSQVAMRGGDACRVHRERLSGPADAKAPQLLRVNALMSPVAVQVGFVVPFSGDMTGFKSLLESTQPQWVVVGGAWGPTDVLNTPMGERFGVQLHAAALEGRLQGEREAPYIVQLGVAWLALAVIEVLVAALHGWLGARVLPWAPDHAGHRFMMRSLWPLGVMLLAFFWIVGVAQALAMLRAATGYWIPSAPVAAVILIGVVFVWNLGLSTVIREASVKSAWHNTVWNPIVQDLRSIRHACAVVRGAVPASNATPSASSVPAAGFLSTSAFMATATGAPLSRLRAGVEVVLATASLVIQTGLPVLVFASALARSMAP